MEEPRPLTLRDSWLEFADEFLSWDRGLGGTFRRLWSAPGEVMRDYTRRRLNHHTRPLRYLLLSIAVNIIVLWLITGHLGWGPRLGIQPEDEGLVAFLTEHAALFTLFILPFGAALMRLLYTGLDLRYVDALVALAYTQAQVNWTQSLVMPVAAALDRPALLGVISVGLGLYVVYAWASCGVGPAWRRWSCAFLTLVAIQALNSVIVLGVDRYLR